MTEKVRDTDDYPTEPFKDFQKKRDPNKRPYFAKSNALLDIILKSLAVFLTVVPLGIFIFFVYVEFKKNTVIIDSFDVPKELQDLTESWYFRNDTPFGKIIPWLLRYHILPVALYNHFVLNL